MNEYLNRINQLARKAKKTGLSEQEENEQKVVRRLYLQKFREQAHGIIQNVKVLDPEGNDVTPKADTSNKKSDN